MYRFLPIMAVLCMLFTSIGCDPGTDENGEPEYQLAVPPAEVEMPDENADPPPPPDLTEFEAALEADPDDIHARFAYMTGLQRSGRINEGLEQARILLAVEGDDTYRSVASLNFARMVLEDVTEDDAGRTELITEAMDLMWIALGWEPESVPGHLAYGRLALEAGDDDKALHHLAIALSVTEIGYELRIKMAELYIERDDMDKANVHLEVAQELAEEADDNAALSVIHELNSELNIQ